MGYQALSSTAPSGTRTLTRGRSTALGRRTLATTASRSPKHQRFQRTQQIQQGIPPRPRHQSRQPELAATVRRLPTTAVARRKCRRRTPLANSLRLQLRSRLHRAVRVQAILAALVKEPWASGTSFTMVQKAGFVSESSIRILKSTSGPAITV